MSIIKTAREFTLVEWIIVSMICLLLASLAISVYGSIRAQEVKSGIVIDKQYVAAHTDTTPITISDGNKGTTTIYSTTFYPEEWRVTIIGKDKDNEDRERTERVPRDSYDETRIGQQLSFQ